MDRVSTPQGGITNQFDFQVQQVRLACSSERIILQSLTDEAERRLSSGGSPATTLLYGVTPKRREGFVILEAARGIPPAVRQWLEADERILDYTVNDVASVLQERDAFPAEFYQSHLRAPALPDGYALLSGPVSIDSPSDERWFALVTGPAGDGMLYYEEQKALLFLTVEEALRSTIHLYRMTMTLLDCCGPGVIQAHAQDLAALQSDLFTRQSRQALTSLKKRLSLPTGYFPETEPIALADVLLAFERMTFDARIAYRTILTTVGRLTSWQGTVKSLPEIVTLLRAEAEQLRCFVEQVSIGRQCREEREPRL